MLQKLSIIIPTYNEKDNIAKLLNDIIAVVPELDYEIIVVDDNSPDGTSDVVSSVSLTNARVRLVKRLKKNGYGGAVKEGILSAKGDVLLLMDADFSHDPKDIPLLVNKFNEGFDLVIGSRYTKGSKIVGWTMDRIVVSFCANQFAKFVLNTGVNENTTSFRCFKAGFIDRKDVVSFSNGYVFLIQFLDYFSKRGAKVAEVPISFSDRVLGVSKLNTLKESIGWVSTIVRLKFSKS